MAASIKLLKTEFENQILSKPWLSLLAEGNLYEFEKLLYQSFSSLYDKTCHALINHLSSTTTFVQIQKDLAQKKGLKKLIERPVELQLRTGTKISYPSLYAKQVPPGYKGSRHLSVLHWSSFSKSSPMYQSLTCLLSVISPSFSMSKELLRYQGVQANYERTRELSLSLAQACMNDRVNVQLAPEESLADKRVVIAMDGGRTRTRVYAEENKAKRTQKFDTPWREPKFFVITTIDKKGKINKQDLPIYDSSFGDDETFAILEQYLKRLSIEKAKDVQFIADGAPWMWSRAKPMLKRLGVANKKIIETLDYYHAMEHLHELILYIDKEQQEALFSKLKQALWQGDILKMERLLKQSIPGVNLSKFTPYQYFFKHRDRIDYESYKRKKRPIGSGVVESAIRRVINLRFKSPSTFWYPQNVEKLILMRGIALTGRWEIMMSNLAKQQP